MKVKIIAPDAVGTVKEVAPVDGQKIPVAAGEIVQFEGAVPVVAVPVGLDLVVFFEDGSSVVLEGFFGFEEGGLPPSIDLGEGRSFFADYGFQADEGPVGIYFSRISEFNPEGYEPFLLSAVGGLGLSDFAAAQVEALGNVLEPVDDGLTDEGQRLTELLSQGSLGKGLGPQPVVCVDGVVHVSSGSGTRTLTICDDSFTVTRRSNNTIQALEGNDIVWIQFQGLNLDVQDNVVIGGYGNDTVILRAIGDLTIPDLTDNDGDIERNIILGDGVPGAAGNDVIVLQAITAGGDVGRNEVDAGDGDNTVVLHAFEDVEMNLIVTGSGADFVSTVAGRSYYPEFDSENPRITPTDNFIRFSVVALNLPGGDNTVRFESVGEGMTFNVFGDADLDNVSWVNRSNGGGNAVLAFDRNADGQITAPNEIDFGGLAGIAAEFDLNGDDVFDAADPAFANFRVWQDVNGDGRGTGSELRSFADLGITSVSLLTDGATGSIIPGEVNLLGNGTFTTAAGTFNLADVSLVAVLGGEEAGREDNQNNTISTGGGNDIVELIAHQDVQSNVVFTGEGNDGLVARSDIDDLFANEFFLGAGNDSAVLDAQENIFDNVVVLGGGEDTVGVVGDRILDNVIDSGDAASEREYTVMTDEFGNWTLDTATAIPVGGIAPAPALDPGVHFDVSAEVSKATLEAAGVVAVVEVLDILGTTVLVDGNIDEFGNLTLTETDVAGLGLDVGEEGLSVTVVLIPGAGNESTDPVEFLVTSLADGTWVLDTGELAASSGVFEPLTPGETFTLRVTASTTDTVIENESGVNGGGLDIRSANSALIDINDDLDATSGAPIIAGTSAFANSLVTVSLDLLDGNDPGDGIFLRAVGEINDNEIFAGAGNDTVRIEVTGEPVDRSAEDPDVPDFQGGANRNTVHGRSGNDRIEVIVSGDGFMNGGGSIVPFGATGNELRGGSGNDRILILVNGAQGDASGNTLVGGTGMDTLIVEALGAGASDADLNTLEGGDGIDTLRVTAQNLLQQNMLRGGDGNNVITVESIGTESGIFGRMSFNIIEAGGGNDTVRLTSRMGLAYLNTIVVGGGDDSVTIGDGSSYGAQYLLQAQTTLDGGSNGIAGDTLVVLKGGEIYSNGVAVNFETLDVTNGAVNAVTVSTGFFDGLTSNGTELTVLGDAFGDTINLNGEWFFNANDTTDPTRFAFTNDANLSDGDQGSRMLFVDTGLLDKLDMTNQFADAIAFDVSDFDLFINGGMIETNGETTLTILGDAGIDTVDLSSGEWDFVMNDSGLNEYVDNIADGVTRSLFVQDSLMTTLPAPVGLDMEEEGGAGGEMDIDFGRLAEVSGGDGATASGADGAAGLVVEQLLDVSESQYAGVLAAVDALGNGDGGAITPLEMSMARVGGVEDGSRELVGSPGALVEGEAALDDGLVMA